MDPGVAHVPGHWKNGSSAPLIFSCMNPLSNHLPTRLFLIFALSFSGASMMHAGVENPRVLEVVVEADTFKGPQDIRSMGPAENQEGETIGYTERYLTRNGQPWMPVMGEFHFSRYDPNGWELELKKMKAGGIDIVATYVFWNHHEEQEGEWDWTGSRNLRAFVQAAQRAGLLVFLRIGPWCHGEVRYGGLPDWIVNGDWKIRSNDAAYLAKVETWYAAIGEQITCGGLLWEQGGPVIGIQLENEYGGPAEHLMRLKELAVQSGLRTPLYTKTGWPRLTGLLPYGEMIPLFGVYAEGFWNHSLEPMPGNYREGFHFSKIRTSSDIGSDQLGTSLSQDEADAQRYPYLTCEVGGGMMNSYHRRVKIDAEDVESTALVKFGSGGNLLGYYMYHGGWNPDGKHHTLQESLETDYPNDMPVKNYDFQAPLGAAGTVRRHYHGLRMMHLFMRDYEGWIAHLQTFLPKVRPRGTADTETLRWSVRSNGDGGLMFFNNYERLQQMQEHSQQFEVEGLQSGPLVFPSQPVTVQQGDYGYWPFRMEIAPGFRVEWLTAQLICKTALANGDWVVFAKSTGNIPVELAMQQQQEYQVHLADVDTSLSPVSHDGLLLVRSLPTGLQPAVTIESVQTGRQCHLVLLDDTSARKLWKGLLGDQERVVLTGNEVVFDQASSSLEIRAGAEPDRSVRWIPGAACVRIGDHSSAVEQDGLWAQVNLPETLPFFQKTSAELKRMRAAGKVRDIPLGKTRSHVAVAPVEAEFEAAASWQLMLPDAENVSRWEDLVLQVNYIGDVLHLSGGELLWLDDFYNGEVFEAPIRALASTHGFDLAEADSLQLEILPLQSQAPIYLYPAVRESLSQEKPTCELIAAQWVMRNAIRLHLN